MRRKYLTFKYCLFLQKKGEEKTPLQTTKLTQKILLYKSGVYLMTMWMCRNKRAHGEGLHRHVKLTRPTVCEERFESKGKVKSSDRLGVFYIDSVWLFQWLSPSSGNSVLGHTEQLGRRCPPPQGQCGFCPLTASLLYKLPLSLSVSLCLWAFSLPLALSSF